MAKKIVWKRRIKRQLNALESEVFPEDEEAELKEKFVKRILDEFGDYIASQAFHAEITIKDPIYSKNDLLNDVIEYSLKFSFDFYRETQRLPHIKSTVRNVISNILKSKRTAKREHTSVEFDEFNFPERQINYQKMIKMLYTSLDGIERVVFDCFVGKESMEGNPNVTTISEHLEISRNRVEAAINKIKSLVFEVNYECC